ncbi:hypothetical protein CLV99_4713 [Sphingobacterium yanglingense]|uniref:Uncharacterized protein n=1 Tax=Sphingobacterium yanglingense TaxID=1437280 RepID=A0A4R6W1L2_9SPHI|nr:hypothetical protein CLV99_4713 [Sphingobacterium yanglingense]
MRNIIAPRYQNHFLALLNLLPSPNLTFIPSFGFTAADVIFAYSQLTILLIVSYK